MVDANRRIGRRDGITAKTSSSADLPSGTPSNHSQLCAFRHRLRPGRTTRTIDSPCAASQIPKPPSIASGANPCPHPFSASASGCSLARVTLSFAGSWKLEAVATSVEAWNKWKKGIARSSSTGTSGPDTKTINIARDKSQQLPESKDRGRSETLGRTKGSRAYTRHGASRFLFPAVLLCTRCACGIPFGCKAG